MSDKPLILQADDDPGACLMVSVALEREGFSVIEAHSGEEAIAAVAASSPDLVLLDVVMPGIDGFEACERIRAMPTGSHVPIVMVTGLDDVDSIARAYDAGATDFLTKPLNYVILNQRLRYILRATSTAAKLRESEARLSHAQHMARLASWTWTPGAATACWSEELYALLGATPSDGSPTLAHFLEFVHEEDRALCEENFSAMLDGRPCPSFEHRIVRGDGEERTLSHVAETVHDSASGALSVLGTVQDVTERRRDEQRITQLVYFDELTGLPNRVLISRELQASLDHAMRSDTPLALLSVGLDRFRRINNTLGHEAGDRLLLEVAQRLRHSLRWSDTLAWSGAATTDDSADSVGTLARIGGDEFLVLLSEVRRPEDAAIVAHRILEAIEPAFSFGRSDFTVTASIGVAVYPDNGTDPQTLLTNAEAAMAHAKDEGRNNFKYYSEEIHQRAAARLSLESRLRQAIDRGGFELHYQPRVDPTTHQAVGAEALIRWRSEGEYISPADFIPLAEETGLIVPMGEWALETACAQLREWLAAGTGVQRVSVNLSGAQFHSSELVRGVNDVVRRCGLDPSCLELEVTESALIEDTESSRRMLLELRELGVAMAVDDFGTGYSSMSYLKRFPLDALKIDRCFVQDLHTDPEDRAIVSATVSLGHAFGLKVVAEGVENALQLDVIRELGCDEVQGYYYSGPLSCADLCTWMRDRNGVERLSA